MISLTDYLEIIAFFCPATPCRVATLLFAHLAPAIPEKNRLLETPITHTKGSVTDPGCLSRILIYIHPGSRTRISDSGSNNSNKRGGKICCPTFLVDTYMTKLIIIYLWIPYVQKKNLSQLKKLLLSSQNHGFGIENPRSGIRKKNYSGSWIQKGTRFRIPDPQHWRKVLLVEVLMSMLQIRDIYPRYRGLDFFYPWSRVKKGNGSRIRMRNKESMYC